MPKQKPNEQVQQIPLSEIRPFKNHPFKVTDDELMQQTLASIDQWISLIHQYANPEAAFWMRLIPTPYLSLRTSETPLLPRTFLI